MKRSEMISKLCEPINIADLEGGISLWLCPKEADAILSKLEKLGMLPPSTSRGGCLCSMGEYCGACTSNSNFWDAE